MQKCPSNERGYKEQQYFSVIEEDYDYSYNEGSSMQMMKPDHSIPKHSYNQSHSIPNHTYTYNQNHPIPKQNHTYGQNHGSDHSIPKHNYSQNHAHAYGGHNNNHGNHAVQYSYEEERRHNSWGAKNDHSGHGGNRHYSGGDQYPRREGMNHAGYGAHAHQGNYGHSEYPGERKKASVWDFKSIVD